MNNSERNELRKRFKKDCSISRLALCYVNSEKKKIVVQHEAFLQLPEEDLFKYLDIAKKSLGGTVGDNLIEIPYTGKQESGDEYKLLMALRDTRLEDEKVTGELFDKIIENYVHEGNFLITVLYDNYDVPHKGTDKLYDDESEEVFTYVLVSICPVNQTKGGLGYLEDPGKMGSRFKDWVAGAPETAFMFPSFTDRGTDLHAVVYYTKNAGEPRAEIVENVLGGDLKPTPTQQRDIFAEAFKSECDSENAETKLIDVHETILNMLEAMDAEDPGSSERAVVDRDMLTEAVEEVIKDEAQAKKVIDACVEALDNEEPIATLFVDRKAVKASEPQRREAELMGEIVELKQELAKAGAPVPDNGNDDKAEELAEKIKKTCGLEKKPGVVKQGGRRYIMVPAD